jgi:hypothetical protein
MHSGKLAAIPELNADHVPTLTAASPPPRGIPDPVAVEMLHDRFALARVRHLLRLRGSSKQSRSLNHALMTSNCSWLSSCRSTAYIHLFNT